MHSCEPDCSRQLHWADILVFSAVLVISAGIGLVYAIRARKTSAEELFVGDRKLPVLPVMFSLSVSFVSAVSILGVPSEIYTSGSDYWMVGFGYIWGLGLAGVLVLPVIYRLQLTSAYEYLELRFNRPVRLMASFTFIFMMICYMAIVIYAPALALSSVTGLSTEISILAVGLVCTAYTALGGIKAVIWTDVFQTLVITSGLLALIVRGTVQVGGVSAVVDRVVNGSRAATYPMDFDPFIRHTFWTLTVGGGFGMVAIYAANQATLQRYLCVETLNKSRLVLLLNIPLSEFFLALMCLCGLVMFAYYHGRDPLLTGRVKKRDQLLPLFVMDLLGDLPGMPGLFIACVFSAALSTVSSGVNSLATVAVEDFLKPLLIKLNGALPSTRVMSFIAIGTALTFGLLTIGAAYVTGALSPTLITVVVSVLGMLGGPLLGLMLVGLVCPWVNPWGAGAALLSSLTICMWTAIGAITKPRSGPADNSTTHNVSSRFDVNDWYDLSYQHYATLAVVVSLVIGSVVSWLTCCNKGRELPRGTYYDVLRPLRCGGTGSFNLADTNTKSQPQDDQHQQFKMSTLDKPVL
ncbi:sodium-dependent multivitamin transporter-like [Physella acuta]|uniref:sodium-dependent multivitamin transporter-like n=1 Tax=Physella acuta TaxID=109671 RepID=UPI0027DC2857|nr:sodium-dependent multivitamin transporter-like [Physella acuta]XP_059152290.1 sodium-dependent multivitamin transporter-like [Physella acuta]XP_059152291.1 sodium-dependent multivitamin transporter-like [Physella acuta]